MMNKIILKSGKNYFLPVFLFLSGWFSAYSQGEPSQMLWFKTLEEQTNFVPSFNYFIFNDSEGFVWISSTAGINRYDGVRVKHYHSIAGDSTSLYDDSIQSNFFEDSNKNLWFSSGHAIHSYQRKTDDFKRHLLKIEDGTREPEDYRVFFLERDTFLWFRSENGIYRYNIHTPETNADLVDTTDAYRIAVDTLADGRVEFLHPISKIKKGKGMCWRIENGKVKERRFWFKNKNEKDLPKEIFDIHTMGGTSWLGTDKGLIIWDRSSDQWRYANKENKNACLVVPWKNHHLLLWEIKSKKFVLYHKQSGVYSSISHSFLGDEKMISQGVFDVYIDPDENIWISFMSSGVMHANLLKNKFKSLSSKLQLGSSASSYYWSFFEDRSGNFWYGTKSNGLYQLNENGKLENHFKQNPNQKISLPANWITSLEEDQEGNILIATRKGLAQLNLKTNKYDLIATEGGQLDLEILYMMKLNNGDILASSPQGGIFKLKSKNGSPKLSNYHSSPSVYTLVFEGEDGKIYACRNDVEIEVFEQNENGLKLLYSIPLEGFVSGFYEDEDGENLWVSSFSGLTKINLLSRSIDTIYTEREGLISKTIHSMLADKNGNLWLTTPRGLVLFEKDKEKFRNFTLADGMHSSEFHLWAGIKRKNGELWFGGNNGITIVKPEEVSYFQQVPKIQVTDIMVNDEPFAKLSCEQSGAKNIHQINQLVHDYEENTLSFEFVAIDYSDPKSTQLQYQLEGVDKKWVVLDKGVPGFARYSNLREGDYRFLVKGANSDGVWGESMEKIAITINPPFKRTLWFRSLVLLGFSLAGFGLYKYRIKQIRERAAFNTRIADNKMAALRAQMNPHFVFNSLQTLSGLIVGNDIRNSVGYISQFARLMRMILENSRMGVISLEKEIELLELYMKVEARRFKTPFTNQIRVAKEVDTYSVKIPSMLLQPFVENAIKHGLFHKKEQGNLDIAFILENDMLKCIVEDNGIGRVKSSDINKQRGRQHESRGLEIVQERLNIIRTTHPGNYDVQIVDLYDRSQNPTGTRVEVFLPIGI